MEKLTAELIRESMIGSTSGHMASIPNSPIIFGLFSVYERQSGKHYEEAFVSMLEEMVEALGDKK